MKRSETAPALEFRRLVTVVLLALQLFVSLPGAAWAGPGSDAETMLATAPPAPRLLFEKAPGKPLGPLGSPGAGMPGRDLRVLVIKLVDDGGVRVTGGRLAAVDEDAAAKTRGAVQAINEVLDLLPAGRVEPLFRVPAPLLDAMRRTGERNTGVALADLTQFFVLHTGDELAGELILEELRALPAVETAYARARLETPVDIPPMTPNFENGVGPSRGNS